MARLTQHGLRRVLGTSALFSTAYGNVGSSIYYALGLVASYALGLTPVVFLLTGAIFYLTAATYAEATANRKRTGENSSHAELTSAGSCRRKSSEHAARHETSE